MSTTLTTKSITTKDLFASKSVTQRFEELLGKKAQGFITSVLQTVNSNGLLSKADPTTILNAAATAAALDLPINNSIGYAYIIPYKTKQKDGTYIDAAQFQLSAKGFKQLAMRTGQFQSINSSDVKEGELLNYDRLTGEMTFEWMQNYEDRKKAKTVGFVSYFELANGFKSTFYMSVEEAKAHGQKYSKTFKYGTSLWKTEFDLMALKTVSKLNLSKNAPLSIETIQTAVLADQSVQIQAGDYQYPDNDHTIDIEAEGADEEEARIQTFITNAKDIKELEELEPLAQGSLFDIYQAKKEELSK